MRQSVKVILVTLIVFIFKEPPLSIAQVLNFSHISTDEGLSNNSIRAILKDSNGFIWIGTNNGLNLLDGYKIKIFTHNKNDSTSLSHNIIECIYEDHKGNIWIGTLGGGLNRYNKLTQKFISYEFGKSKDPNFQYPNSVMALAEDNDGNLWLTTGFGLKKFNDKTNEFEDFYNLNNGENDVVIDKITDIVFDKENTLWISTYGNGVYQLNFKNGLFKNYQRGEKSINDNNIWDIYIDSEEKVWFGSENGGINKLDPTTNTVEIYKNFPIIGKNITNTNVNHIIEDNLNNIWFATDKGGLYTINRTTKKISAFNVSPNRKAGLTSNALTTLYCDEFGVLWVGTFDSGINKTNINQFNFFHFSNDLANKNTLSNNFVNAIYEDSHESIWIGTENGLNKTDLNFTSFQRFLKASRKTSINDNVILSITETVDQKVWFGTYSGGINIYDHVLKKFSYITHSDKDTTSLSSNFIRAFYPEKNQDVWIGTVNGALNKYIKKTEKFQHYPFITNSNQFPNNENVMDIEKNNNKLYLATFGGGLNVFDLKTGTFTYYTYTKEDSLSISDNFVITLFFDSTNKLWVGTNNGLNCFDQNTREFECFYEENGLASNSITGILEDDDKNLWISTTNGISKYNLITKEFTNFYKEDGLQENTFIYNSCAKLSNGMLAFGGINGLSVFDPRTVKTYEKTPKVFFTELSLFNKTVTTEPHKDGRIILEKPIGETDKIVLSYNDKLFSIEFSTLTYYSNQQISFSYRLNKDEKWLILKDENYINFHNLNPGKYNLEVRTISKDGKNVGEISSIKIVITPPFWATWGFRISALLSIVTILLSYNFFRITSIKKQRKLLEDTVEEKTVELQKTNSTLKDQKIELEMQNEEISTQRDVSESQREEIEKQNKELELYRFHLENLVKERTLDLVLAKERAEEADRLKSSFLANMSHEIRTPMNAIIGFLELIDDPEISDRKRVEFKNYIAQSAEKLLTMINDLLDLAKIESNQISIIEKEFSLQKYFSYLINHYQNNVKLKNNLKITFESTNENDLRIVTDRTRLNQIMTNLIDNAYKYTEKGEVTFGFKKQANEILFFVKDTGYGIAEKDKELIFDRFRKINLKNDKVFRGTGLGLAICKELVELMHGKIWVESEIEKGSQFYFTLPLHTTN